MSDNLKISLNEKELDWLLSVMARYYWTDAAMRDALRLLAGKVPVIPIKRKRKRT